jgi:hypothetical protein
VTSPGITHLDLDGVYLDGWDTKIAESRHLHPTYLPNLLHLSIVASGFGSCAPFIDAVSQFAPTLQTLALTFEYTPVWDHLKDKHRFLAFCVKEGHDETECASCDDIRRALRKLSRMSLLTAIHIGVKRAKVSWFDWLWALPSLRRFSLAGCRDSAATRQALALHAPPGCFISLHHSADMRTHFLANM